MRRLAVAALTAAALAAPLAHAEPQCYSKPFLYQDGSTLYVSVQTGRCTYETVAIPLPIKA